MKKTLVIMLTLAMGLSIFGCGMKEESSNEELKVVMENNGNDNSALKQESEPTQESNEDTEEAQPAETTDSVEANSSEVITNEQALEAIKKYCYSVNPDLEEMEKSGDYTISFEVSEGEENQIVVLYRSYTAALVRYYIDATTGETYETEFVEGITPEESRTTVTFNVRDYM